MSVTRLGGLPRRLRASAGALVRRVRARPVPGEAFEAECRRGLDVTYQASDPFKMESPREQFRFAETNRILQAGLKAARVRSILEIGCGEGHQSEYLARLCDRLTGIDVAASAIERARVRVPGAELIVGDLREQSWAGERHRFDIVVACEVIYYFTDIPRMLRMMSTLGRGCLVTYHRPAAHLVEGPLKALPIAGHTTFVFEKVEWRAAWWSTV